MVGAGAVLLAACGGSDDGGLESGERPLGRDEANRLADALFDNFDQGGASFTYTGQIGSDTLVMRGDIDFVTHQGRAAVEATGPESAIVEVVWSDGEVIERIPALADLMADSGRPPVEWVLRPPAIDERELDTAIALVIALASEQRDNPQLIQQLPGSAFVRRQMFRGREVEILRYGDITTYWLDVETSDMVRFEANNRSGTRPRLIDLVDRGDRQISAPSPDVVTSVAIIGDDLYGSARRTP